MPLQLHTTTLYLPHTLFSFSPQLFLFLSSLDDLAHAPCWSKAAKAIHLTNDTSFQTGGNCCAINNRSSLSPCNCVPRLAHTVTGLQDCHDLQCMKQTSRCGTLALSISCGKYLITVPVTAAHTLKRLLLVILIPKKVLTKNQSFSQIIHRLLYYHDSPFTASQICFSAILDAFFLSTMCTASWLAGELVNQSPP